MGILGCLPCLTPLQRSGTSIGEESAFWSRDGTTSTEAIEKKAHAQRRDTALGVCCDTLTTKGCNLIQEALEGGSAALGDSETTIPTVPTSNYGLERRSSACSETMSNGPRRQKTQDRGRSPLKTLQSRHESRAGIVDGEDTPLSSLTPDAIAFGACLVSDRDSPAAPAHSAATHELAATQSPPAAPCTPPAVAASAAVGQRGMDSTDLPQVLAPSTLMQRSSAPILHTPVGAMASVMVAAHAASIGGALEGDTATGAAPLGPAADTGYDTVQEARVVRAIRIRTETGASRGAGHQPPSSCSPPRQHGTSEGGACPDAGVSGPGTDRGVLLLSVPASPPTASTFSRDSSAFRFDPAFLASHWQGLSVPSLLLPGAELWSTACDPWVAAPTSCTASATPHHSCGGEQVDGERGSRGRHEGERSSRTADRTAVAPAPAPAATPPVAVAATTTATAGASARPPPVVGAALPRQPAAFAPVSPPSHGTDRDRERTSAGLACQRSADPDPALQTLLSLGLVNAAAYHKARRRASETGGSSSKTAQGAVQMPFILPGPYLPPGMTAPPPAVQPGRKQRRMSAIEAGTVRSQFNADVVFGALRRAGSVATPRDVLQAVPSAAAGVAAGAHPASALPPSPSMSTRVGQQGGGHSAALPPSASMPTRAAAQQGVPHPATLPPSSSMPTRLR